jgi:hypothetical protein
MPSTILLDTIEWDLVIDADGNIARADEPYSLAQDAASAIRTFLGEVYFDTSVGVPYLQEILGKNPPLTLLKAQFEKAALTVQGVVSAVCYISELSGRRLTGQIQVTSEVTGQVSVATFTVINPQGVG